MPLIPSVSRQRAVAVLIYHGITPAFGAPVAPRERKYWIPEAALRQQLEHIRHAGYRTMLLEDLWTDRHVNGGAPAVVLTFDDGRASDYETAFPMLLQAGARAEFFVNTSTIGRPGHLTWSQMEEMQRGGMSFQSHAHEHVALITLPPAQLRKQLDMAKDLLEGQLGRRVRAMAAPYGILNRRVNEAARQAGYEAVCNSRNWYARRGDRVVNRVPLYRDTTPGRFAGFLDGDPTAYLPGFARMAAVHFPKRIMLKVRPIPADVPVLAEQA